MDRFAWLLVVCLVLAGCAAADTDTDTDTNATRTTAATAPATTATAALPTSADTPARTPNEGNRATVTRVVDGDTIEIRYRNGTADTVRLLGVDTPEVHGAENSPEYEGVPDTDAGAACLRESGQQASEFLARTVEGREVKLVVGGDRRDRYDRLLAFVFVDRHNLNHRLVAEGYARVYDSRFDGRERFYRAETRAQREAIGLWQCANGSKQHETTSIDRGPLAVVAVNEDPPGNDNANLAAESVVFENTGRNALDLSGWTVRDEAGHSYTFPTGFTLDAGERVALHTGRGSDTRTDRYWGATNAVWNNDGDTVFVENSSGAVVIRRSYA